MFTTRFKARIFVLEGLNALAASLYLNYLFFYMRHVFGAAVGLIYYSSLFYSMDVGDTKGEHGGFHEAALGLGIGVGPAVAAGSLCVFPAQPNANTWAVTLLLAGGLAWLMVLRWGRDHAKCADRR